MRRAKTYAPEIEEMRAALKRKGFGRLHVAKKAGIKPWLVYQVLDGSTTGLESVNKVRVALALAPLTAAPAKPAPASPVGDAPAEPAAAEETLPACNWRDVATAAAELSEAAADFDFLTARLQEAEFRLRAARRRALAAGIAVAPALTGSGAKTLQANQHTTRFFRMLGAAGAIT